MVDAAGQNYPEGYVPHVGFVQLDKTRTGKTLAEWYPEAVNARQRPNARTKADTIRDIGNHVPDWLAEMPMAEITYINVGTWLNELREKGLTEKTIKNIHGMVSTCVEQAKKDRLVEANVFKGALTGVHVESAEMDFMTPGRDGPHPRRHAAAVVLLRVVPLGHRGRASRRPPRWLPGTST